MEKTGMAVMMAITICWATLFSCAAYGAPSSGGNCDHSQCPKKGITKFYSELNCQPIYDDASCCSVRYDCSFYPSKNANKCLLRGEEYEMSASIPANQTMPNCLAACICQGGDRDFLCAHVDCPEFLGGYTQHHPSCYLKYSLHSCCSKGYYCPTSGEEEIFQCEYNGEKYKNGQRFYANDECKRCICSEGYDGTTNGPWCQENQCSYELVRGEKFRAGCAPVYLENGCCPYDWHCPSENDQIIEGPNHSTDTSSTQEGNENEFYCSFGSHKLNLEDKLKPAGLDNIECTCSIPPYLSCILTPKE